MLSGVEAVEGQEKAFTELEVERDETLRCYRVVEELVAFLDDSERRQREELEDATCERRRGVEDSAVGRRDGRASGRVVDAAPQGGFRAADEFMYEGRDAAKEGSRLSGQDLPMVANLGVV